MEDNILKQAKSDLYKALDDIVSFDIKKGVTPHSLKRYYKKPSHILEMIKRIKNKSSHLFKNENEYQETVRDVLHEILDDRVTAIKDKAEKHKYIKEWHEYDNYTTEKKKLSRMLEFATDSVGAHLDDKTKNKILRYFRNYETTGGDVKLWNDIYDTHLNMDTTLWAACSKYDQYINFKSGDFSDDRWYKIPTPNILHNAIEDGIRDNLMKQLYMIKPIGNKCIYKDIETLFKVYDKLKDQQRFDL